MAGTGDDQVRPPSVVTDATLGPVGLPLDERTLQLDALRQDMLVRVPLAPGGAGPDVASRAKVESQLGAGCANQLVPPSVVSTNRG